MPNVPSNTRQWIEGIDAMLRKTLIMLAAMKLVEVSQGTIPLSEAAEIAKSAYKTADGS